jgi:serine/threonine protein kinase/WD40 repeat protein
MTAQSSGKYELLDQIVEEFAARFRRGERPALAEYTQRYPELAEEIRELFPAVVEVERVEPAVKTTPPTPLRQVGDYRILREIGRGGMGVVYEAEQSSLGRRVALKVLPLHGGADGKAVERFKREARAAAKLHHTNIVPVFEVGEDGPVCFYAMQFIQGQGLDQVIAELRRLRSVSDRRKQSTAHEPARTQDFSAEELARSMLTGHFHAQDLTAGLNTQDSAKRVPGPEEFERLRALRRGAHSTTNLPSSATLPGQTDLSAAEKDHLQYFESIARIGRQTASALAHAHERGIIHRDIKPSNLLLDATGIVWVTDFGLAKTEEADLTNPGDILGTFRYMAPERFKGHSDPRSDVYALGITLYELLVLRPAFEGRDRATLMSEISNDEPPRPRSLDRRIPRDLETIVTKAIAKDPARRYPTAEAIAEDLSRFLENRPILARRVSTPERVWRWCRRNRAVALLLSAVFLLLICLTIGSIAVAVRLSRQSTELAAAEVDRTAKVYETFQARLAQAYASRASQHAGQRFATLDAVREAAALVRQRQMPAERLQELRNLAIAALSLPDLRTLRTWKKVEWVWWDTDPQVQLIAQRFADGSIAVTRIETGEIIARCKGEDRVRFSPTGRFLLAHGHDRFQVWDLDKTGPARVLAGEGQGFAFHPDGRCLLVGRRDGSLRLHDLASPDDDPSLLVTLPAVGGLAYDPPGKRLAVTFGGQAKILDAHSGRTLAAMADANHGGTPAWHPSGNYLAIVSTKGVPEGVAQNHGGRDIHLWDLTQMKRLAVLRGCPQGGVGVVFTPDGDRLLGRGLDRVVRLWDWRTGRLLLHQPGYANLTVSPAGCFVIEDHHQFSLVALASGQEYRSFVQRLHLDEQVSYGEPIIHPGGRLLGVNLSLSDAKNHRVALFDLVTGEELATVPQARFRNAFLADGSLVTNGDQGLLRWPIQEVSPGHWHVGPPILLYRQSFVDMSADRNGDVIGQANHRGALLVRPGKGLAFLGPHGAAQHIIISPNGRYAVTGINDGEEGVKLWDTRTRRLLKVFPMGRHCCGRFSPDGQRLAMWGTRGSQVVQVGTWNTLFEDSFQDPPFAPDGSLMAVDARQGIIRLVEPASGREVARLEDPNRATAMMTFSPDGTRLVSSSDVNRAIHVWDLRAIRQQLAELGLDWETPPYPPAERTAPAPLRVTVDSGWVDAPQSVAIQTCRLAWNPWDVEAYIRRGQAYNRLRAAQPAVTDFSIALALMPADHDRRAEVLLYRSFSYQMLGNRAKAWGDLEQIAEVDLPLSRDLTVIGGQECNDLAWHYVTGPVNERNPDKALTLVRKAIKLTPEDCKFFNTRGVVHYRLGQYPQAVEWLERSLREANGQAAAFNLFFLAMCHAKRGDAAKARNCHNQAVRWVDENRIVINSSPGWSQELQNFRAEAEAVVAATGIQ